MERILITGGCGFIGSNLVSYHLLKGDEVLVVDDLSSGTLANLESFQSNSLLHIETDTILNWPELKNAVQWANRIYHMSAIVGIFKVLADPVKVVQTNIGGCECLFQAMMSSQSKARLIIASSSSVYGASKAPELIETDDLIIKIKGHSLSTYAISKIAQEAIALAYFKSYQIRMTLVRLFNTVGLRQTGRYGMVVPRFIQQACNNEPITVFGDGTQTRSFCDVRDAVKAMDLLAESEKSIGEIVNVGNTHEISINELARLVQSRTQSSSKIQYVSYYDAYGPDFKDTTQRRPNIDKLYHLVQYKPQWSLENTIDDLAQFYKNK